LLHIDYIDSFEATVLDVLRDFYGEAERADIAMGFFSFRDWAALMTGLLGLADGVGPLRVIVRRDASRTCPYSVGRLLGLRNTQVAFELADTTFHSRDYLLYRSGGKCLTVVTSSASEMYPGLKHEDGGGAVIRHDDVPNDEAAKNAIAIFERRWASAQPVNEEVLAEFRTQVGEPPFKVGDLARSTNEIFRDYGVGRIQKVRGPTAKVEYDPSVFMSPPYRSENKLLVFDEMERIDTPLDRAAAGRWEEPWRFELKMLATRFLTGNKGGQLSNARTEILPHQIFAAHRVVSSPRRRFLLADEVGLGKTIEAGMIWQALAQRGQARRTLVITPAGLTTQWQEEFQDKFGVTFEIFGRDFWAVNPLVWGLKAKAIASIDTLKRKEHREVLLENRRWDLIIFDEAHRLSATEYGSSKTEKTQNYRLAEEVRSPQYCDAMLLLTATPHQGEENHSRFKNLLALLDDDIDFSGLEAPGLFSGSGSGRKFTELVIRTPKKDVTDANGHKVFKGRQTHRLPFTMYADEARSYKAVAEYIRDGYQMLERVADPTRRRAAGFLLTTFQKLNASSTEAIRTALSTRLARLKGELCALTDNPDHEDDDLYDERYEGEHEESFVLQDSEAILKGEVKTLDSLLAMKVRRDKKLDELLKLVAHIGQVSPRGEEEKVLIFTEYRRTQRHLVEELEGKYGKGSVVVIHGGMKLERREEADMDVDTIWEPFGKDGALVAPTTKRTSQRLFRDHEKVRFLVSTEAGGEGINLQFCHICVNYDLPWNPMRVEQRVGRVYRFGQEKVVQVYHFFNKGTIEEKVQSYFEDRLERAAEALAQVTGEDPEEIKGSLNGQLESEIDPPKIYQRALVDGNLNKETQREIQEAVGRARQAYEIATKSLFRDVSSYTFDSYRRELASDLTLADLQRFTERFLAANRRQLQRKAPFVEFIVPEVLKPAGLPERYRTATFDRQVAIKRTDADFLAIGHPFVDAMLEHVGSYDFGGLTAVRHIASKEFAGRSGYLFVFVVRERITREGGDECLFRFSPVFVDATGKVDEALVAPAVTESAVEVAKAPAAPPDPTKPFEVARKWLGGKTGVWDWDDDVEFIGTSWVEFLSA
jgi:ERCC4-related helicase